MLQNPGISRYPRTGSSTNHLFLSSLVDCNVAIHGVHGAPTQPKHRDQEELDERTQESMRATQAQVNRHLTERL